MAKGVVYTGIDDSRLPVGSNPRWQRLAARRGVTVEEFAAPIIAEHNARWSVVGRCPQCAKPLIADELLPHTLSVHVSARVRAVARDFMSLSEAQRVEIAALIDKKGVFSWTEAPAKELQG